MLVKGAIGSQALHKILDQVNDLKHPESIRFPLLTKYMATVCQVCDNCKDACMVKYPYYQNYLSVLC